MPIILSTLDHPVWFITNLELELQVRNWHHHGWDEFPARTWSGSERASTSAKTNSPVAVPAYHCLCRRERVQHRLLRRLGGRLEQPVDPALRQHAMLDQVLVGLVRQPVGSGERQRDVAAAVAPE